MDLVNVGERVNVEDGGAVREGIVFDTPSRSKVVVAVFDARRGPVFRTVHPRGLSERTQDGTADAALRLLIRRTPPPGRRGNSGGTGVGTRRAAHTRGAMHRSTGK
jgi:hypothetical protein